MKTLTRKRRPRIATLKPLEHDIQSAYFKTVRLQWPGNKLIYAVPNGGKRNIVTATKLKAEGVTAGIPDVNIDLRRGEYIGMRVEFKVPGRPTSEEQDDAIAQLRDAGYLVRVHTDALAAFQETKAYLCGDHLRFRCD